MDNKIMWNAIRDLFEENKTSNPAEELFTHWKFNERKPIGDIDAYQIRRLYNLFSVNISSMSNFLNFDTATSDTAYKTLVGIVKEYKKIMDKRHTCFELTIEERTSIIEKNSDWKRLYVSGHEYNIASLVYMIENAFPKAGYTNKTPLDAHHMNTITYSFSKTHSQKDITLEITVTCPKKLTNERYEILLGIKCR